LRYSDGIPSRYRKWSLAAFPVEWALRACDFIEGETESLYLCGNVGSRKTTFAATVLMAWRWTRPVVNGKPWANGIFLPAYKAANVLRNIDAPFREETLQEWRNTPLLLLDDIGANRSTPHLMEQLNFLVEERYDWETQTIITSNLTLDGFAEAVNARAASRLGQGIVLDCGEKDWRKDKAN